jgi:excisionase family DNA binding protein
LQLIDRKRAAELLGVSIRTLDKRIKLGEIPATRVGARVLIPEEAIADVARRGAMNEALVELLDRSTAAHGVPTKLDDDCTIEHVAQIMRGGA